MDPDTRMDDADVEPTDDVGALPWKFSQCFGEKTVVEEMTEGKTNFFIPFLSSFSFPSFFPAGRRKNKKTKKKLNFISK